MIEIRVEGLDQLQRQLRGFERQIPFATSVALNAVAFAVKRAEQTEMGQVFERVKPWVQRQVFVKKSTKTDLTAIIGSPSAAKTGVPGKLDDVLMPHVFGRDRVQRKAERMLSGMGLMPAGYKAVPSRGMKLDQYGNIPLRTWKELTAWRAAGKLFVALPGNARTRHLSPGVYRRLGNRRSNAATRVQAVVLFQPSTQYSRRLDWFGLARRVVEREMPGAFAAAARRALESAR